VRLLLSLFVAPCLFGQDGMGCVKEMMVPNYSYVARRTAKGGYVRAKVTIGSSGKLSKIQMDGADRREWA
jgi:hypothetical protein